MEDVRSFFRENDDNFTIYVVEQRFVVGRGSEYFRSYKGKINYIDTDYTLRKRIGDILSRINKYVPDTSSLIKICFDMKSPLGIIDIISSLSKLFSIHEHQAAGPDVIDPIIIQEGKILSKHVNQMIALHKCSILRPAIIILLKDNDFERAKKILSKCPHNTNIKMIRNSGETEIHRVINCGADNPDEFLDAFSYQCFSTCSNTKRNILYNEEWAKNSLIKLYAPSILQIRTKLLFRDKTIVRQDLNDIITAITDKTAYSEIDTNLLRSFECILRLFRVFCNDGGVQDINVAHTIAKELDNEILLAHVYRNAYFFDNISFEEKLELMNKAYNIFTQNHMEDHAIYCKNNKLVREFDTQTVSIYDFLTLQEEAINNVPGLVGMSHILNNVGTAHLVNGSPEDAIEFYNKGLDYAYRPERRIQKIALLSNRAVAKSYCYDKITEKELRQILNLIFDNKEVLNLPFLSARYALNIIAIAYNQDVELGQELISQYSIETLIKNSLADNVLGSGQLLLQIDLLKQKYNNIDLLSNYKTNKKILPAMGIRKAFIEKTTYNPCSFSTWF